MRPSVVAIFAHPDDEAFGPAGTLKKLSETNDVYILCATKGHEGNNYTESKDKIFRIRTKELLNSAKTLGVKRVYFLGFRDGNLNNNNYHKLAAKIEKKLDAVKPQTIITFEPRGVSGHIDHIVVSMVSTYVYNKLPYIKTLLYYCITEQHRRWIKDYFIYFPPGYNDREIDKTIDVSDVWEDRIQALLCHKSQQKDIDTDGLPILENLPKKEHFLVLSK